MVHKFLLSGKQGPMPTFRVRALDRIELCPVRHAGLVPWRVDRVPSLMAPQLVSGWEVEGAVRAAEVFDRDVVLGVVVLVMMWLCW